MAENNDEMSIPTRVNINFENYKSGPIKNCLHVKKM